MIPDAEMPKTTAAGMLREVVDVLRTADKGFELLGDLLDQTPPRTNDAQSDLLMMATWLDAHPDIDVQMVEVVQAGDGPRTDEG